MPKQKKGEVKIQRKGLPIISLIIAIVSLILTFTGIPGNYDTEPLLAIAIICLAIVAMKK